MTTAEAVDLSIVQSKVDRSNSAYAHARFMALDVLVKWRRGDATDKMLQDSTDWMQARLEELNQARCELEQAKAK